VDDTRPGIGRQATGKKLRQGKRFVPQFVYLDPQGRRLHDADAEERIRKLVIPPAWTDVWICPDPDGHIQATGRDARGRKQYIYHPGWREWRELTKFMRILDFAAALPKLRERVARDLSERKLSRTLVLATAIRVLDRSLMRVGNDEYARHNQSFGLTTLLDEHIES